VKRSQITKIIKEELKALVDEMGDSPVLNEDTLGSLLDLFNAVSPVAIEKMPKPKNMADFVNTSMGPFRDMIKIMTQQEKRIKALENIVSNNKTNT